MAALSVNVPQISDSWLIGTLGIVPTLHRSPLSYPSPVSIIVSIAPFPSTTLSNITVQMSNVHRLVGIQCFMMVAQKSVVQGRG